MLVGIVSTLDMLILNACGVGSTGGVFLIFVRILSCDL